MNRTHLPGVMSAMAPASAASLLRSAVLALVMVMLVGCELPAFIATMGGRTVKAAYTLPDRPTLIMVDDPRNALGNPALSGVVAANAAYHLRENDALDASIVPPERLTALAARLGDDFPRTPVDQVGRMLDAEQVIHVLVESVSLATAPGVYRPTAVVQVKVVDAVESRRLFPDVPRYTDPASPPPGQMLRVQMTVQASDLPGPGQEAVLARALAEEVGLSVARLFYDWKRPEPGSRLER